MTSSRQPRDGGCTISRGSAVGAVPQSVSTLRRPETIRERAGEILEAGEAGALEHFRVHVDRLGETAALIVDTIRERYPDLVIPPHSRWRHFSAGGVDRWGAMAAGLGDVSPPERARIRIDLAVTSVLLDAGAGARWKYQEEATGQVFTRSEGLAVASVRLFESGALSSSDARPWRADADGLERLGRAGIEAGFQCGEDNPLVGAEGRAELMAGLARALRERPNLFGDDPPRPGGLHHALVARAPDGVLPAPVILETVLEGLSAIWPGRISLDGVNLGDVWRHPRIRRADATHGLMPFHKLSQWLSYSLVEPLEEAGVRIVDLDSLTGLAEYRNGGLFVDTGVLELREAAAVDAEHDVGSELVVEWRALTVALLDRLAPLVRDALGVDAEALPLASLLEGGTWAAGRRIASERRPGGGPPIRVRSDGTVF